MFASFSVQAAEGATYAIVPLIKEEITGQIAGSVGAWGNVGGVAFLLLFSLLPTGDAGNKIFFSTMGISSLIMFFLLWFFLKEPTGSHEDEESELQTPAVSSDIDEQAITGSKPNSQLNLPRNSSICSSSTDYLLCLILRLLDNSNPLSPNILQSSTSLL